MIKNIPVIHSEVMASMAHQKKVFEESRDLKYYGLWWEMGTGKSKTLIDTTTWLYCRGEIDGVIIVSDKGAYLNWPVNELPKHIPENINWRDCIWDSRRQMTDLVGNDDLLDFLIMNVEAFSSERALKFAEKFTQSHYTMIVVDEATSIKSMKSERTKNLIKFAKRCDYRRILTGTPIVHSPLDLYAQCEFLQHDVLGHRTFVGFRSEYAIMQRMNFGSRSFDMIAGYKNLDKLTAKIQPFSSRILKDECLDLPDKVYEIVYVEHTPQQRRLYDDLKVCAMSQFEQGLLTTTSAITTINKLHQINCGHVKLNDGTTLDIESNRITALMDILDKVPGKVLIWCAFQRDVVLIMRALDERYYEKTKDYACHYYGESTPNDRERALKAFSEDQHCRWFVGTAATGGKGLTLTQATTTVYYSNSDSAEDRWQSEDRNHRIGQISKVTYHDLVVPGTVDEKILRRLRAKEDLAYNVLDKFRELMAAN